MTPLKLSLRRTLSTFALPVSFSLSLSLPLSAAGAQATPVVVDTVADRAAVLATVTRLFDGMRKGDSAMVRSVFHAKASMATASVSRAGVPGLSLETVDDFARAVGTPHTDAWDERIYAPVVHLDGGLASVWTEYSFFLNGKFTHCGVDAIQLARTADGWRIFSLADTRRRTGCQTDPSK